MKIYEAKRFIIDQIENAIDSLEENLSDGDDLFEMEETYTLNDWVSYFRENGIYE